MALRLVFGSNNRHKRDEIALSLRELPVEVVTAESLGAFDPEETALTLEGNAAIKVQAACALGAEYAFADDTGLMVDALDGRPGIYAARYAGPGCSFSDNVQKLLRELQGVEDSRRTAEFICVIAFCQKGGEPTFFKGHCPGRILNVPVGCGGFGYDPIFFASDAGCSLAELDTKRKNAISHRGKAVEQFKHYLQAHLLGLQA